jgi:hypothetical protein
MSDNIVEITQTSDYTISIDTSLVQNDNNVVIELSTPNIVDVIDNTVVLVSDLPYGYPIAWTSGDLPISRVSGLIGESGIYYNNGTIGISGIPYDLIPVHNILNGSGISVTNTSGIFTIAVTGNFGLTSEEVDDRVNSLLIPGNYITLNYNDNANTLTISTSGLQPSGNYSTVGHTHTSSNITDFNSAVSGLIPPSSFTSLTGLSGIVVTNSGTNYFVALNDPTIQLIDITDLSADARTFLLTPSSNNLQNLITNETGSGVVVFNNSPEFSGIPTVPTAPSGTNSNQIANTAFVRTEISNLIDSAPSTLDTLNELAAALGDDANFATTVTNSLANKANLSGAIFTGPVTIPSGTGNFNSLTVNNIDVSISGHSHTSSNITDFNSSVSGLLPVKNVSAGSGIGVTSVNGDYTVSVTGTFGLTSEEVDDRISELLVAGTGINLSYNDNNNTLTVSSSGLAFLSGANFTSLSVTGVPVSVSGHKHSYTDITNFASGVQDSLNTSLLAGAFIELTYDSIADSLTISATGLQPSGSYANSTHTHGNISNSGTIGSTSGLLVVTGNSGILTTSSGITSSYITNFNSSVSGLLPSVTGSGYVTSSFNNNIYTISVTGLQPSGNYSLVGHTHGADEIYVNQDGTYFSEDYLWVVINSLDQAISSLATNSAPVSHSHGNITNSGTIGSTSGLLVTTGASGIIITSSGISSSYITDFNSSVSGLLPVKNIVGGSGIGVSALSGTYTVAVTGISGLISEEVDDRVAQLLVEGTGVNLTYNDASGTLTIDNLHTEINILSQEPQGFVNRADSIISFNDSTRTFTIQPAVSGGSYNIYVEGIKVVKSGIETVVVDSGTALNYIHFDTTPPYTLHTKTTGFDFDTDVPIAFIHWNSDINQSTFFGEERHGIRMDSTTHRWIHNTFGMQYISGLSIGGYVLLGDGSSNSHAQIDISDGVLYQEDIIINITDDNGTNSANEFVQELNPIAYIPTYYHSGSTGQWVRDIATAFPVKYNGTRAQYNLLSGGTWTTPNVTNDRFFAMWIVATNDINDPILAIVGQREDSSLNSAESNNTWSDINLTNIPTQEIRPLYRLIFKTNSTYTNTPKSSLQSILDIRVAIQSTSLGVVQNDHGSLFGLADDDHSQYVHIDNNRTISALHTFNNGLNASGLINAASGNFTSLTVNSTGVSLVGHTHTSADITNFNSSVSGLLPTISNSGDNRILTSDGTSTGIVAESGMTFNQGYLNIGGINNANPAIIDLYNSNDGNQSSRLSFVNSSGNYMLSIESNDNTDSNYIYSDYYPLYIYSVGGPLTLSSQNTLDIIAPSGAIVSNGNFSITNQTANTIASFDGSKNVTSLATGIYPSLTELSYVKGVTSSIQTQLNGKQNTLTNPVTGTGILNHIAYWNSSSGIIADSGQLVWDATNNRLGLGTSSPSFPLHVSGNAFIDGDLVFDSFTESVITIGNSSTAQTLSLASGTVQTCTLTGNCTFTMPSSTAGKSFTMFLNSGSGNYTASFSGVLWSDSAPPTITTTASKVDILSFISDGTYWYGSYSQNYG